ncbi:MAG: phosphate signaling complex protein PhoU [Psychrosphaera sp.]|nr:phosphate signaling complex protein PhoU [Psychrosphaera sp.]
MENDLQLNHHISRRFNEELEEARNQIMKMGGLVESQVENGLKSLLNHDIELAHEVVENDQQVNQLEIDIDENCLKIMARRQPAASDLRLMITIIKTITDLERIGDEAIKLSKNAIQMSAADSSPRQFGELRNLGERVKTMLGLALDAYARMDVDEALRIIETDKLIDEEFDNISRLLITRMMEDPREIKNSLRISHCARALERIGDHSKNICEFVVYLVKGKDVRHGNMGVLEE